MVVYADSSALVKRYVAEQGSDLVAGWLAAADVVACCRVGFVEVYRAIMLAGLRDAQSAARSFERDWAQMAILEVHDALSHRAALLAVSLGLRSLDGLHLAAAEELGGDDFNLMTWDRRLWNAARSLRMSVLPEVM